MDTRERKNRKIRLLFCDGVIEAIDEWTGLNRTNATLMCQGNPPAPHANLGLDSFLRLYRVLGSFQGYTHMAY